MRDTTVPKSGEELENFYMYNFKITTCPTKYAHDWTSCPYAHSGESARRRDPSLYKPIPCPESKGGNPCPRGDSCKYAHNDFEYWLHPARYKTEYCKQGPGCSRKICFFAHRPEEIRTAPTVVFTKQGPFIDSATTARNKHKLEHAFSAADSVDGGSLIPPSPWRSRSRTHSGALNNASSYGDHATVAALAPVNSQPQVSPRQQFPGFSSAASIGSQLTPRGYEETGQTAALADLQAALSALTMTSTPTTPFGDVSPLGSQTPTTPWSASAQACYNPFARMTADSFGNSDQLLTYLHGLQRQHLCQTPRSIGDYISPRQSLSAGAFQGVNNHGTSSSWKNDLVNLAQMINTEAAAGDSILASSLSDGVIHRGGPPPGSLLFPDPPAANERP